MPAPLSTSGEGGNLLGPGARAITIILLTLLAIALRAVLFDRVEFKSDQAQASVFAWLLVHQHILPQTSLRTSGGFYNPPFFVYLMALPQLVTASPLWNTAFITALNVLAVPVMYLACRRALGDRGAAIAVLLYAVSPMAIHYSRSIWAPDAMPFFTVLLLWGVMLALGEGNALGLLLGAVALAALVQLHQAAAAYLPLTLLLLVVFARRLPWRRWSTWACLLGGVSAFLVLVAPYIGLEWRGRFADVLGAAHSVGAPAALKPVPWVELWQLIAGWNPALYFDLLLAQEQPALDGSGPIDWAVAVLALIGVIATVVWLWQGGERRVLAAFVLPACVLPPAIMMRSAVPVFLHYLVFVLPLGLILVAIGIETLALMLSRLAVARTHQDAAAYIRYSTAISALLAAAVVAVALVRDVQFNQQLALRVTGGDYGVPLTFTQALMGLEQAAQRDHPTAIYLEQDGDLVWEQRYFTTIGQAPAATVIDPALAQLISVDPAGALYVFRTQGSSGYKMLDAAPDSQRVAIPPAGTPAYSVFHIGAPQIAGIASQLAEQQPLGPFTIGAGLRLTAGSISTLRAGQPLAVALVWQVTDVTPFTHGEARMFLHLYDKDRKTLAQQDALGYPNAMWKTGDRFITWFTLTVPAQLPPGQYTLVGGLYAFDGVKDFNVRGPHNEDLGGEIPLATLTVGQ